MNAALLSIGQETLRERFHDVTTCPRHRKDDRRDYSPLSEGELRFIEAHMQALAPALATLPEARAMPGCEFGNYAALGGAATNPGAVLPDLADVRVVARNVADKAVWEANQGNTEEALKWVAVNMRLANDLTGDPLLIVGLVRVAVTSLALDSLERILHDRGLPENVPEELYQELAGLRDRENLVRFIDGERCFAAAYARTPGGNPLTRALYYTPGKTGLNRVTNTLAEALLEEDYAKREALLAPLEEIGGKQGGITMPWNMMVKITAPALLRAVESFERQIAIADLALIALSIKTYHRDTGNYPESLGELVPEYLDALPADAFSGEPYIYKADQGGFLLFSVGPNGKDDGGAPLEGPGGIVGDIVWCGGFEPAQ
jgi:hypothetical protein